MEMIRLRFRQIDPTKSTLNFQNDNYGDEKIVKFEISNEGVNSDLKVGMNGVYATIKEGTSKVFEVNMDAFFDMKLDYQFVDNISDELVGVTNSAILLEYLVVDC